MSRCTRRIESICRLALLATCAVAVGAVPSSPPQDTSIAAGTKEFAFNLDLTEDLYHRIAAGLFVAGREPVVLRLTTLDAAGLPSPARGTYVRIATEYGALDVRTDTGGAVVVHVDAGTLLSHPVVWSPATLTAMSREFAEYPRHPIQ